MEITQQAEAAVASAVVKGDAEARVVLAEQLEAQEQLAEVLSPDTT